MDALKIEVILLVKLEDMWSTILYEETKKFGWGWELSKMLGDDGPRTLLIKISKKQNQVS